MTRLRRLRIRRLEASDDREVMALARAHRLTAYDASYLALAGLDRRLNEAATAEGVDPFV